MTTDPRTMRPLLRACRRGDDRAARSLHAHAFPILTACAHAILRSRDDAEDAAQRTFLSLMRQPTREIDRIEDPLAWLIAITRREALTLARASSRARRRDTIAASRTLRGPSSPEHHNAPHTTTTHPDAANLADHIDALPRHLREVLALRHIAGLTFDQISLATGINRSTAAARHRRAIDLLRESLQNTSDPRPAAPPPAAAPPTPTSEAIHA